MVNERICSAMFVCARKIMLRKTLNLLQTSRLHKFDIINRNIINLFDGASVKHFAHQRRLNLEPEDTFGSLAVEDEFKNIKEDEEEPQGDYFGKVDTIKNMKACLDAHEYDNAKELLVNMQKRERAPPHAYKLLINYSALVGNIEEAFRLFNDFKKRGYYVDGAMYTSLFNACSICQRADVALPILYKVTKCLMQNKNHKPNMSNYNAMLKALGRHGEIPAAFQLVDKLHKEKKNVTARTYCFLIQACITDRSSGLRFALLVWHDMLKRKLKPCIYTFQNIAKCAQVCSIGEMDLIKDFIKVILGEKTTNELDQHNESLHSSLPSPAESQKFLKLEDHQESGTESAEMDNADHENSLFLENKQSTNLISVHENSLDEVSPNEETNFKTCQNTEITEENLPNLLDPIPTLGSVVDFGDMSKPENRFLLFGGLKGFIKVMRHFDVKPDKKLFSILMFCIPRTPEALKELSDFMEFYGVKKDIQILNNSLKLQAYWDRNFTFQKAVDFIINSKVKPDFRTVVLFARVCRTREEGKKCLELTKKYRITISDRLITTLLNSAKKNNDKEFISDILTVCQEDGVVLSTVTLEAVKLALKEVKAEKKISDE